MNHAAIKQRAGRVAAWLLVATMAACGGGGGSTATNDPAPAAACDPTDATTFEACGTVLVGLTDADGDFITYTVDVVQLTLTTASGRVVEALPRSTRIDFADYVDLTELLTAATVPPATYVSGTITLDYANAEVYVETGGEATEAVVTDHDGNALARTELDIVLSDRDRLVVTRGRPALLQLDFDLAASHLVDLAATPVTAAVEPFIVAEVAPVEEKDMRVRGPLVSVNEDDGSYIVAIRPFHDHDGDFGRVSVHTTDDTEFEVDGIPFLGSEGLRALGAAGPGTPTVAAGTLDVVSRTFTAHTTLAGSSVPGSDFDAVVGNVIARDGNFLTVRGAKLIPWNRIAHFHDDIVVEVGPNTTVLRDGDRGADLDTGAISIGQRVTVRGAQLGGSVTDARSPQILFDATEGAVRLHLTRVSGVVNSVIDGQTDITLHSIDRRRVSVFDFAGTGMSPDLDAAPDNYEIATGDLAVDSAAAGQPIVARGFPAAFGAAPPDFNGRTIVDYSRVRSALGVGWGAGGTTTPFTMLDTTGLLLDNRNPDIDARRFIKQGPVLTDLTTLGTNTLIEPATDGRALFYIRSRASLQLYTDYGDFLVDLAERLDGVTPARSVHARGHYDAASNILTANKIGIHLVEP